VDVAVVFPHSATPGHAAAAEERVKDQKYRVWRDQARIADVDFSPLVFEAFGRAGEGTLRLLRRLAGRAAADLGLSPVAEYRRWLELLSASLQLSQADALLTG